MSAIRAICYYLDFKVKSDLKSDIDISTVLAKCVNQTSNDVKLLSIQIVTYLSVMNSKKKLDDELLKLFIPMLVNGTREKAPSVRLASEIALVELLQLKSSNIIYDVILFSLLLCINLILLNLLINLIFDFVKGMPKSVGHYERIVSGLCEIIE